MAEDSETFSFFDMVEYPYATCISERFNSFGNIERCGKSIDFCSVTVFVKLFGSGEAFKTALIDVVVEFIGMLIFKDCVY